MSVGIGEVDALAVVDAELIVDQAILLLPDGEEVALDLNALVTAAHVGFAETVAHTGEFLDEDGEVAHTHIPGIHGILEGKGALELTDLDGELLVLGPFDIEILDVRIAAVGLELDAVLEVIEDAAVDIQTDEPAVEPGAAVGAFKVAVLVGADDVAAHLGRAHESGLLVTVFGRLAFLGGSGEAGPEKGQRRQRCKESFHIRLQ